MVFRRNSPASFILLLQDEATAVRAYNDGQPFASAPLKLPFRRWSRSYSSSGSVLARVVEVTINDIPAHAWELATTELLLDEFFIRETHPDTINQRDIFRLMASYTRPDLIPKSMELLIEEPQPSVHVGAMETAAITLVLPDRDQVFGHDQPFVG